MSDHDLTPWKPANFDTYPTILALQRHTEWVSQSDSALLVEGLETAGFRPIWDVVRPRGTGGQAYIAQRDKQIVVAFRGTKGSDKTETAMNTLADLSAMQIRPRSTLSFREASGAKVHMGFCSMYERFQKDVRTAVESHSHDELYLTGFSLGSALATLAALDLQQRTGKAPTVVVFGTPRVGNAEFAAFYEASVPDTLRVVLDTDPVARIPLDVRGVVRYQHVGRLLELRETGEPLASEHISGLGPAETLVNPTHLRDLYEASIRTFLGSFGADPTVIGPGRDPLLDNARVERETSMLTGAGLVP